MPRPAHEEVRRKKFDWFYTLHVVLGPGSILLAALHSYFFIWFLLPPFLLYGVDSVLTRRRKWRKWEVLSIEALPGSSGTPPAAKAPPMIALVK